MPSVRDVEAAIRSGGLPADTPGYRAGRIILGILTLGLSELGYTAIERERGRRIPLDQRVQYTPFTEQRRIKQAAPDQVAALIAQIQARSPSTVPPINVAPPVALPPPVAAQEARAWPWILVVGAAGVGAYYYSKRGKRGKAKG